MSTPRPHEFKLYFASKDLPNNGDPLPARTVTTAGDARTFTASALTQTAGFWNGATGWFAPNTPTSALRGRFFHVRTSAVGGIITLAKNLPAAPAVGDSFVLACGGWVRSGTEVFGMSVAGNLPELFPYAPPQIPGVTVVKVSPSLGEGTLTLTYTAASRELFLRVGTAGNGPGVALTANATNIPVYDENERGFILVNVTFASLPTADRTQAVALAFPQGTFIPDIEGYETGQGTFPKFRYHPLVLMNTNEDAAMVALAAHADRYSTASGTTTGTALGTAVGRITLASGEANWPTNSFWIRNNTRLAARYVRFRSGRELSCSELNNYRGMTATANWSSGDSIEVMSDIDIGVEYPNAVTGAFANPANVYTAPAGVTFFAADTEARSVQLDDLAPGRTVVLWIRETIVQDHRARNDINGNLRFQWS